MGQLEEIEAIKRLKYRYMRCVDLKLWDDLRETFAPDATSAYGDGKYSFTGRDAIVKWLREAMEGNLITLHQVHHPEIELTGPTTARGTWYLQDFVVNAGGARPLMPAYAILHGSAFYHDEYVKLAGEWKIQHTGYERVFESVAEGAARGMNVRSRWEKPEAGA
jgi:hypothetical protein